MGNVQLFVRPYAPPMTGRVEPFIELDLLEAEPIKMTISVQDIEDPMTTRSSFSKVFKVPHTGKNGAFFKAAFNVNDYSFDITKKAEAYINIEGNHYVSGNISLGEITYNASTRNIEYSINFYGETSDFSTKIGGGFMNSLNLDHLNHFATYSNVTNSFYENFLEGKVIYGLAEWGYTYDNDNVPDVGTFSHGFAKSFTDIDTPLEYEQLKPMIRIDQIWNAIFAEAGYTYEPSNLMDLPPFKGLYLISESKDSAKVNLEAFFYANSDKDKKIILNTTDTAPTQVEFPDEVVDLVGAYDPEISVYTAVSTGIHKFEIRSKLDASNASYLRILTFSIMDYDNPAAAPLASFSQSIIHLYDYNIDPINLTVTLNQGKRVYVTARLTRANNNQAHGYIVISDNSWECYQSGEMVKVSSLLPDNVKKVDFIKGIVNKFKLVMEPSKDHDKHFIISPWNEWIKTGTAVDWTNKIDGSKDMTITPLFSKQKRKVTFTDKEDTDYLNDEWSKSHSKEVYGRMIIDSNIELITGEEKYESEFAPIILAPIASNITPDTASAAFLIPHIAKDSGGSEGSDAGKREPIKPNMRLAYYNGIIDAPIDWYIWNGANGTGSPVKYTDYPLFSNYSQFPVTDTNRNSTFDLNFRNETPLWDTANSAVTAIVGDGKTPNTCYNIYWKDWYEMTYDPYSRMVTVTVILSPSDIMSFRFNDVVFVRDTWYYVNKISDYVIGSTSACKVELIKVGSNIALPVTPPSQFTKVTLSYSTAAYCTAYCCFKAVICNSRFARYVNGTTFTGSTHIYMDPYGAVPAPAGYYSDGVSACYQNSAGAIEQFYNVAACGCNPIPDYSFSVLRGDVGCETKLSGASLTVYGESANFKENEALFLDSAHTIPAPEGFYREISDADAVLQVAESGYKAAEFLLDDCPSTVYVPFTAFYEATACDACCSSYPITVYGDNTVWTNCTKLWLENSAETDAPVGSYSVGGNSANVTPAGTIASWTACSSCSPCPDGTVDVSVCLWQDISGVTTTGTLYKSIDNTSWVLVGSVEVTSEGDPSMTPTCTTFKVETGYFVRCVYNTDMVDGTITETQYVDTTVFDSSSTATPCSVDVKPGEVVDEDHAYTFSAVIEYGESPIEYYAMDLYHDPNVESACQTFCHYDMTATEYYGNDSTLASSNVLYQSLGPSGMGGVAEPGYYSDGVIIALVGDKGAIIEFYDQTKCNCFDYTKLYPYKVKFSATSSCDCCCSGTDTLVYAKESSWPDVTVLYEDGPSGIWIAATGWYALNDSNYVEIDSSGVVISTGLCIDDCTCTPYYATYRVVNRTVNTVTYSYTDIGSLSYTGTIAPGKYIDTECMYLPNFYADGYCEITEIASCGT